MADETEWTPVPEGTTYEDLLLRTDWEWCNVRNLDDGSVHTIPRLGAEHALGTECWCKPVRAPDCDQYTHQSVENPIQVKYLN